MITKEEMEFLKQYETNLNTALYSDYSRNVQTNVLKRMQEIYEREREIKIDVNYSCGQCQLSFLKKVAKLYFETQKAYKELEPELTTNELQEQATTTDNKSKKKTTKKNGKK